ncbi:substrate-binding domain-containing protein [Streptomyces sp. NPDC005408]|uniref:substrate-binding domain-containing protein n=1 Tax=Streptomyces sp. NPDC005408 TaxID=3155341 RepID=UPI0033B9FBF8
MRFHVGQRHERVLELVRERGSLRISDLATELEVSAVTLRRDVELLAAQGRLGRLHGAVVWPGGSDARALEPEPATDAASGAVIAMIVPTTNHIFADVVRGARDAVEARGGRLVLGMSGYLDSEDPVQAERLLSAGADGLLVAPGWFGGVPVGGQEKWLLDCTAPVVLVERWAPAGNPAAVLDRVRTDRAHGAAAAVGHFAALGHEAVAAVIQDGPHASQITTGYLAAVETLGLRPVPGSPFGTEPRSTEQERYDASVEYLVEAVTEHGVTAALVHSDEDAIVLLPRLRARGISVPGDLALIAYDDEVAELADVPLTAVAPPKRSVGELAAKLLLQRLGEAGCGQPQQPRRHLELLPELRIRSSCGAAGTAP